MALESTFACTDEGAEGCALIGSAMHGIRPKTVRPQPWRFGKINP
jgi:hypothetical protein